MNFKKVTKLLHEKDFMRWELRKGSGEKVKMRMGILKDKSSLL